MPATARLLVVTAVVVAAPACRIAERPSALHAPTLGGPAIAESSKRVVVTLRPDAARSLESVWSELAEDFDLETAFAWPLESIDVDCIVFDIVDDREVDDVAALLAADERVESAQPVQFFELQEIGYDDPHVALQHAFRTLRLADIHRLATGRGVRVAVVDTGIDATHPDLQPSLTGSRVFVTSDGSTSGFHGTAVAGVIAAAANNRTGVVGVAPEAELVSLRACVEAEPGAPGRCDTFSLAKALDHAVVEGARVLNLSFAGPPDPLLTRLLKAATSRGSTVVAAADEMRAGGGFPAALREVIAVRALDLDGRVRTASHSSTDRLVAAPGVDILTTVPGGGYDFVSGSSFAAAHVSGVTALILEQQPDLSPAEVHDLLKSTGQPCFAATGELTPGTRRVDVCAALSSLRGRSSCDSPGATAAVLLE